jgi:hypothetical protein
MEIANNICKKCGEFPEIVETPDPYSIFEIQVICRCGRETKFWATEDDAIKEWEKINEMV